ncbi:MAG: 2-polyprenylphenol 6-hydroxylase [Magnetococcales bacterium]|nr:2-polyprenylphenol 6-hydroxylase [Magnetococcales bacterium]
MLNAFRNLSRLFAIYNILVRHRVGPLADNILLFRIGAWMAAWRPSVRRHRRENSPAARLRMALEELGPTFIKFGQALSTRMDTLPDEVGLEMKKLQDSVPPFPYEQVEEIVQESLGAPIDTYYSEFNKEPVASASIAQVHKAMTRDGREVAVKVIRPNAASQVEADIRILTSLARLIDTYIPDLRRLRAVKVVDEFAETIRNEMDFTVEASHAQQFRENFKDDDTLQVPEVIWPLTTPKVLTLGWISGTPVSEYLRDPDAGPDRKIVAENMISAFFNQVFRDGYFHADQHPGNMFVKPTGAIAIVDFGMVGQVPLQTRLWLAEMLKGFLMRDYRKVAQIHLDAEYIPPETDIELFEEACRQVGEPIFGRPLKEISIAKLLGQMFKVTERFQMEVQPQLLLLQKTMFTLEGVGREVHPDLNMWQLAEPLVRAWMKEHMGPKGKMRRAKRDMQDLTHVAGYLPRLLHSGLERLAHDRMHIRLHPDFLKNLENRVDSGFRRQATSITGGLLFLGASVLIAAEVSPLMYVPPLTLSIYYLLKNALNIR